MAAKGSAVWSLQKEATCPVCQDIYCEPEKLPKKLPCDHSFCLECLQKLILRSIDGSLTCPVCRDNSPLGLDASQYPTAHHVNRFIDIYHQTLQEQAEETPAVTEQPQYPTCSLHRSQPLAVYCKTCQKAVCRDCALFVCPKDHDHGLLQEVAKEYKDELVVRVEPLQDLRKQISASVEAIKEDNIKLEKEKREELEKIEASFENILLKLKEQKKQVIPKALNSYEVQLVLNTSKVEELEEALRKISTSIQKIEDTDIKESLTTNEGFMSIQKQYLQDLCDNITEIHCQPRCCTEPCMKLEYIPQEFDPRDFLLYTGKGFKCRLSEYDSLKTLKLKQPFQIQFRSIDLKKEAKIKSKLICMYNKSSVPVSVTKTSSNQISLSATPQTRGSHELHVLAGDSHICDSPIPAFVLFKPHQLPLGKVKLKTLEGATVIRCIDCNVMVSSASSTLNILEFKNQNQTITRKALSCHGIRGFAIHQNVLYYSDIIHDRLVKANMDGQLLASTGERGSKPGQFVLPNGVKVNNSKIFVCDTGNGRIQIFNTDLHLLEIIGNEGNASGQFLEPKDLVFDEDGNMYVVEYQNNRIQVLSPRGYHIRFIGNTRLMSPTSLALHNGHLFVTDSWRNCISVFTLSGTFVTSFAGEKEIESISIDGNGFIYVTNNRKTIFRY